MILQRHPINCLRSSRRRRPDSQRRPVHRREQIRIQRDAIRPRLLITQRQPAQIAIRQISKRRMLMRVVAIPLDHRPIELLPPRPRNGKSRCPTCRSTPRSPTAQRKSIADPDRASASVQAHNRMITVRSRPGKVSAAVGTDVIFKLTLRLRRQRRQARIRSPIFDVVAPSAIVNVQYTRAPRHAPADSIRRSSAGRFIHHRENIPRRVRRLRSPAAAPHPSESPGTLHLNRQLPARKRPQSLIRRRAKRRHRHRAVPRTFVMNKFRRADAHIRQKNRLADNSRSPDSRRNPSTNGTIVDIRPAGDK